MSRREAPLQVVNPRTGRRVNVDAKPSSTFGRLWLDPAVRRVLVPAYPWLVAATMRLGIATPKTPLRFVLLASGDEGVANRFLHAPRGSVRVVASGTRAPSPPAREATRATTDRRAVPRTRDERRDARGAESDERGDDGTEAGGDGATDDGGEPVDDSVLARATLCAIEPACLLDPGALEYPVCTTTAALDCRALQRAELQGRRAGTRESLAIANTARDLHAKFCSGLVRRTARGGAAAAAAAGGGGDGGDGVLPSRGSRRRP